MRASAHTRQDSELDAARRDAGAQLAELRRELARYRGAFDSARLIVAHELAKPLTAASGYLDLLEERRGASFDDRDRAYVAKMRGAFARLGELVESFVEMLRLEREADDPGEVERFDVRDLVEGIRGRFEKDSVRIVLNVPARLPRVAGRRRCIEVVLENLVSNAVKHGGARPVTVTASLAAGRGGGAAGDLLEITVEDRGTGIPEDKVEDVFAPFFRVENGAKHEGLGLGLALVKSVVSMVNGEISIRSNREEGTAVTVAVPVTVEGAPVLDTVG